jgi:glycosyltransferase involved in cell wall biosynthesis
MVRKLISFVVPVLNEQNNIKPLIKEIGANIAYFENQYDYEVIFVDDGSCDDSLKEIVSQSSLSPNIRYISFTKNFGKEIAMTAGIQNSKGNAVIIMDSDLQHPPAMIPYFIKKWEEGADVVIGIRKDEPYTNIIRKLTSILSYKIFNSFSSFKPLRGETDFRLLSRTVVDQFNKFTEKTRMTRNLINWLAFPVEYIEFNVPPRLSGRSSYGFKKRMGLMKNTFISNTYIPLRLMVGFGSIVSIIFALGGIIGVIDKYIAPGILGFDLKLTGTAVLAMLIIFLVGVIITCIGFIGMYIEHIHTEILNRPIYAIRRTGNL